ncbi:MAG: N-6 DNA methylase [Pseudomonadota bacterium]|nr:N-6 DNA methylase [Pseudomonadota bacterium]
MAIRKSDHSSSLWASCDELRGGMDASQYKDYVLFMLFIKYISDKYGNSDDFAPPVTIPPGASFKDMIALKGKSDIGDKINTQIIAPLVEANARLAKSDFPDFNDPNKLGEGRDMVEKLSNLVGIFQKPELDFSQNRAEHDDILGLPANLFYSTGIPACILVLDKENATARKGVFMIDASKGYIKDGNKNRLREQDLHRIVDTFTRQDDSEPRYARRVPLSEIADARNDYNLNLPRYIDSTAPEDLQDIDGHLRGGIPERDLDATDNKLADYWQVLPGVRSVLFSPRPLGYRRVGASSEGPGVRERPGYNYLRLPIAEVKPAIFGHAEFTAFNQTTTQRFADWRAAVTPQLTGFAKDGHPKALIEGIAEALLATFKPAPLLDAYDIYQHLMDYWAEALQDDAYLIAADGWVAMPARIVETDKKGKRKDKGWACDLIPKALIVARYFASEQAAIEAKQAELETATASLAELEEEHSGDDAVFSGFDSITAAAVKDRIREIGGDREYVDELRVLKQWLGFSEQIATHKKKAKELEAALDKLAYEKYPKLTEAEIKTLVVDDKWMARLSAAVQGELDRVSQTLTGRIRELAERYATPLPQLTEEVATLAARVEAHLKVMGFKP